MRSKTDLVKALLVVFLLFKALPCLAADKDYAHESLDQLVDDLVNVDQVASGLTFMTTFDSFIAAESPPPPGWGSDRAPQDKLIPQMSEIVRRGAVAIPVLIAHLNDKRSTKLVVGEGIGKSPFAWGEFSEEYDPREGQRREPYSYQGLPITSGKRMSGEYTLKVGDICFALIGQIVNRNFWPYRYQATEGTIINSPIESPVLAQQVIKDWNGLTTAQHRESLISDIHNGLNGYEFAPALARLKFYYPGAYNSLSGHDLEKKVAYQAGNGGPVSSADEEIYDKREAEKFERAAERGDGLSQWELTRNYAGGRGVPQDYNEALKWYCLAVGKGYFIAEGDIGDLYYSGLGVKQDYQEAYFWYSLAANYYPKAKEKAHSAAGFLTSEQIAAEDKRVAEWKPAKH